MAKRLPMGCSVPAMVERYLGSEYDTVKLVADNITAIVKMAAALNAEDNLGFTLAARLTADGTSLVYDFGGVGYVDETTLFIFTDASWQRPITDFVIGADGTENQGKLVFKSVPPVGTVIDVVKFVGTGGAKVTFATTVPSAANSTPWFVNLATGKTYFAVQGENASYWVEQNSHGEL